MGVGSHIEVGWFWCVMYTQNPCSVPNSETPLTPSDISAGDARLAASDVVFDSGNSVLGNLIAFLGGNPSTVSGVLTSGGSGGDPSAALPGGAGIPTGAYLGPGSGGRRVRWYPPRYNAKLLFPSAGDTYTKRGLPAKRCVVPDILPLVQVFPIPRIAAPPLPQAVPTAPPPPAAADCGPVTSANVCGLIGDGCVLSSQVSPAQLAACSAAGYAGNRNLYPAIAARGGAAGGKYFGDVNLAPAPETGLGDVAPAPWYCVGIPWFDMNTCDKVGAGYSFLPSGGVPVWALGVGLVLAVGLLSSGGGRRR